MISFCYIPFWGGRKIAQIEQTEPECVRRRNKTIDEPFSSSKKLALLCLLLLLVERPLAFQRKRKNRLKHELFARKAITFGGFDAREVKFIQNTRHKIEGIRQMADSFLTFCIILTF